MSYRLIFADTPASPAPQTSQAVKVVVGSRWVYDDDEYILAQVDARRLALINLRNGHRFYNAVKYSDSSIFDPLPKWVWVAMGGGNMLPKLPDPQLAPETQMEPEPEPEPELVPHWPAVLQSGCIYFLHDYLLSSIDEAKKCFPGAIRLATEYPPVWLPKREAK